MSLKLNIKLTEEQKAAMAAIPATSWFTQFRYENAESPRQPVQRLDENNDYKQELVADWIERTVKGKRVLDLFSANGGFSIMAAQAGATEVVGVEFADDRVACAIFVASTIKAKGKLEFRHGNVYKLREYFPEPFDVVLCLGGLYHIADPPYVLREIRALTAEWLILQTSNVWPVPGNWAKFRVRQARAQHGLTSIRGGDGTWHYTVGCLRQMLLHGHFRIVAEKRPPLAKQRRYPWYLALCEPI